MQVAAYIRVSTDEQAEQGISIPAQKSRLASYCKSQGWDIYKFYVDDGYSGKDLNRPDVQNMIEDAKGGFFKAVVVVKLDRLSRRQKDVLYLLEDVFEPNVIGFKSATEPFDTTTPFGKAALGMMAVFAQLERETIIERVKMAKRESAKQGRFLGGPAPYGYTYDFEDKRIEVNAVQAETIKWIYAEYLNGAKGYSAIAEELEKKGVPGPVDKKWLKFSVRKMLTNPTYAGYVEHKGNLYPGKQEAIISKEDWDRVQALIQDRGSIRSFAPVHEALLSGIIFCGECGARMRVKNVWQNYPCTDPKKVMRYYVCYSQDGSARHMVRKENCKCGYKHAEEIEQRAIEKLYDYSYSADELKVAADEMLSGSTDHKKLMRSINQARNEMTAIDKKLERWYSAFEKGALEPDELTERVKELKSRKTHYADQIAKWEKELIEQRDKQISVTELIDDLKNFPDLWEDATQEERKGIVRSMIRMVKVFKDASVKVELAISTSMQH